MLSERDQSKSRMRFLFKFNM